MRQEKNIIYCAYCGKKNANEDRYCQYCGERLHPKNHHLRDYLYAEVRDEVKDKVSDKLFSLMKEYFVSHLYGFSLLATVIFTVTATVLNQLEPNEEVTYIDEKLVLKQETSPVSQTEETMEQVNACDNGFELVDGMCRRVTTYEASVQMVCETGFYYHSGSCLSNETVAKESYRECVIPSVLPELEAGETVLKAEEIAFGESEVKCWLTICYAGEVTSDNECLSGYMKEVEYQTGTRCPSDTIDADGACRRTSSAQTVYSCETGTLNGTVCEVTETRDATT